MTQFFLPCRECFRDATRTYSASDICCAYRGNDHDDDADMAQPNMGLAKANQLYPGNAGGSDLYNHLDFLEFTRPETRRFLLKCNIK
jgi:hypothetical protein